MVVIVLVLRRKKAKNNSVNFNHSTDNEHRGIYFGNLSFYLEVVTHQEGIFVTL